MSDDEEPKLMFLGRDLLKIPCFRRSILYGIGSGIGVGLATFLATSRPSLAVNVGMGTYLTFATTFFAVCRYDALISRRNAIIAEQLFRREGLRDTPGQVLDEVEMEEA